MEKLELVITVLQGGPAATIQQQELLGKYRDVEPALF
jgi:hypothetical protein